jgi:glutathione S-transferase
MLERRRKIDFGKALPAPMEVLRESAVIAMRLVDRSGTRRDKQHLGRALSRMPADDAKALVLDWLAGKLARPARKPRTQTLKGQRADFIRKHIAHAKKQYGTTEKEIAGQLFEWLQTPEGVRRIEQTFGSQETFTREYIESVGRHR